MQLQKDTQVKQAPAPQSITEKAIWSCSCECWFEARTPDHCADTELTETWTVCVDCGYSCRCTLYKVHAIHHNVPEPER